MTKIYSFGKITGKKFFCFLWARILNFRSCLERREPTSLEIMTRIVSIFKFNMPENLRVHERKNAHTSNSYRLAALKKRLHTISIAPPPRGKMLAAFFCTKNAIKKRQSCDVFSAVPPQKGGYENL